MPLSIGRFLQHEYTADLLSLNICRPVHPHTAPELLAVSTPLNVDSSQGTCLHTLTGHLHNIFAMGFAIRV